MKHLFDKQNKYSIRKFSIGVCSAVIGLSFLSAGTAYAEETGVQPVQPPVPAGQSDNQLSAEAASTLPVAEEVSKTEVPVTVDVSASSVMSSHPDVAGATVSAVVDDNYSANSYWISNPATPNTTEAPQHVTVALTEEADVYTVRYTPTQNNQPPNGRVLKGYLEHSLTGRDDDWTRTPIREVKNNVTPVPNSVDEQQVFTLANTTLIKHLELGEASDGKITPVKAKYIRLTALETTHSDSQYRNQVVSAADFTVVDARKSLPTTDVVLINPELTEATSSDPAMPVANATDKTETGEPNKSTTWQSAWGNGENNAVNRQTLTVGLNEVAYVDQVSYTPDIGGATRNGNIRTGFIEYSLDKLAWERVQLINGDTNNEFTLGASVNTKHIRFTPVLARYFRLTSTDAQSQTKSTVRVGDFSIYGRKIVNETVEIPAGETISTPTDELFEGETREVRPAQTGLRQTGKIFLTENGEKTGVALDGLTTEEKTLKEAVPAQVLVGTKKRPIQTPPQAPAAVRLFNAPLQQDGETVSQVAVTLPQEAVASHVVKLKTNDAQVLKELTLEESHLEDGIAVLALDRLLENGQTYAVTIATVQGLESESKTFVADTVAPPAAVSADFVAGTRQVDVVLPEGVQAGELAIVINPEGTTQETYFIGYANLPTGERRVQVTVNQDLLADKTYNVQLMDAANNLSPMIEAAVRQQTPPPAATPTPVYPPVETVEGDYNRPASSVGRITNVTFENGTASITYETGHKAQVNFYNDHVFRFNIEKEGAEFVSNPELVYPDRPVKITLKDQANYQETYGQIGKLVDEESRYILETPKVLVIFDKKTSLMSVYDREKNAYVTKEVAPVAIAGGKTTQTLAQTEDEQFFGGGMQNGRFTHKGEKINIVNENNWIDGSVTSPAPFYWSSKGYGVMRHTFRAGQYDFGTDNKAQLTSTHNEERFDAFYFINSKPTDILKDYYELTGTPAVLPEYALYTGHLNAYNRDYWREVPKGTAGAVLFEDGKYYKEFDGRSHKVQPGDIKENLNGDTPESHQFSARAVIERYIKHDMPIAWFLPNDGYGAGYGQTGTLEGNIQNLKAFVDWANKHNVEVGLWTQDDPHSRNGDVVLHRDIDKEVSIAGIRAIKTDVAWVGPGYNFGLNGVDRGAGYITDKSGEDKARPFIVSLDGWAGTQRSSAIWSGDQRGGEWEYIRFHIPTYIGLGLSGNPNIGSDMDGIFGGGNAIINARDYQWKAFTSILMAMDGWGNEPKTPFAFDDRTTDINRMSMKLKSTLVPYAYSTGHDASVSGKPIVRAMLIDFPDQPIAYTKAVQYQYMYGDNFLVAPVYKDTAMKENGDDVRNNIFLPAGAEWIDLYTGQKYEGGQVLNNYEAPLWKLPVFVKNGAIIPMTNANNNPAEIDRGNRLIQFYPHKASEFKLYEDDGKSIDYKAGKVATTLIKSVADDSNTTGRAVLTIERTEGDFDGFKKDKTTELHVNVSKDVESVQVKVNGQSVEVRRVNTLEEYSKGTNVFFYHKDPKLATYNPTSAEIKALDVTMNDLLKIKLAAHDVTANKIEVIINGFSNAKHIEKVSEDIQEPKTPETITIPEDFIGATAIKVTWAASSDATSYDVDHNGVLYKNIKNTEFNFDNLTSGTTHIFKVRAVNAKGTSSWTNDVTAETKSDPWAEAIDINPVKVVTNIKPQNGQGIEKLFDKKKGEQFHSRWDEKVEDNSYIFIDLGGIYDLDYLEYHQRSDGGTNGRIIWASVFTSEDGDDWEFTGAADGRSTATAVVKHPIGKRARYVHFQVDSSHNGFIAGEELLIFKKPGTRMFVRGDISNDGQITEDDKTSFLNYAGLRRLDSDFGGYVERVDANKNGLIDAYDISIVAVQLDGGVTERSTQAPSGNLRFEAEKLEVKSGEEVKVYLVGDDLEAVNALTATFQVNEADFDLVSSGNVNAESFTKQSENFSRSRTRSGQHDVVFSFINFGQKDLLSGSGRVAYVTLKAKHDTLLSFSSKDNILVGNDLRRVVVDNQPVTELINYTKVPDVPMNLVVNRPTHGSASLKWDAVPQAVRYIVEQEIENQFVEIARINEPKFNVYNLEPESMYKFRISATNPLGKSKTTKEVSITTLAKDVTKKVKVVEKIATTPEEASQPLINFFDGDESTVYHSQWKKTDAVPSSLILDLGENKALSHLIYVPQSNAATGTITALTVETSNDAKTWISTGENIRWQQNPLEKIALFPQGTKARYIRINWQSGVSGFVSGVELYVIQSEDEQIKDQTSEQPQDQNDTTQPPRQITDVNPQTDSGIIAEVQSADAKVAGLRVVFHKETNNPETPAILKGTDYDLFDIELVDKDGNVIKPTAPVDVYLPIDDGKDVAQVVYLPNSDQSHALPFTTITRDGKRYAKFTAEHFSEYGIVYEPQSTPVPDPEPTPAPMPDPDHVPTPGTPGQGADTSNPGNLGINQGNTPDTGNTPDKPVDKAKLATDLLKAIDASNLTDEQKGDLAVKVAFAETEAELEAIKAEVAKLIKATSRPATAPAASAPTSATAGEKSLPATGDAHTALAAIGATALLSALGLAGRRRRAR